MANVLKMAIIQAIQQLLDAQWSQRRIARELNIHRETVARYARLLQAEPKPAISPTGAEEPKPATFPGAPAPLDASSSCNDFANCSDTSKPAISPTGASGPKPAISPTGDSRNPSERPGRRSACEPFAAIIREKLDAGLSAQRIAQDLASDHGATISYDSVKRFVKRLGMKTPLAFRRMECEPGEEAQVDFGTGAPVVNSDGKRRRTYVFRIVLSHSRKAYSEATYRQTTDDFLKCLENAFEYFGGVPRTLVIDNLKAAVAHPDWFDPELTPKVAAFANHHGTVILPTKPYTPRHKGKVESGIKYVKNNGLKGRVFTSLVEQNDHLRRWEQGVADTRIHGTTKQHVGQVFRNRERSALQSLPRERFVNFQEARRRVNRDGHVEVARAYYSAPPEYLGHEVWARWDTRLVRLFNSRWQQIAVHTRLEPGRFSTASVHIAEEKISGLERGVRYLLDKLSPIGPHTQAWSEAMLTARGIVGTRALQGLVSFTKKYSSDALEKACQTAHSHGCYQLSVVRKLLQRPAPNQQPLPFLEDHPMIRPLEEYGNIVRRASLRAAQGRSSLSEGF